MRDYCIHCRTRTSYSVQSEKREYCVRGLRFSATEQIARCDVCGNETYIPEINDQNVDAAWDAYNKAVAARRLEELASEVQEHG